MVPSVAEPPVVPLTDQVRALFVVPETVAVNAKESAARIFSVAGDTITVIEGGGGGGGFVPRVVAEQPAAKSTTRMLPSCSNLHIAEDTHLEPGSLFAVWVVGRFEDTGRKGRNGPMSLTRESESLQRGLAACLNVRREWVEAGKSRFFRFCSVVQILSRQPHSFERCPIEGRIRPQLGEARWFNRECLFAF
jgi:hypothetical protein